LRFWSIVGERPVVLRALKTAFLVGTLLAVINHGDRLFGSAMEVPVLAKILLTFCVPYCVASYAAASALRQQRRMEARALDKPT